MKQSRARRRPVSIDNDELIDFSVVTKASAAKVVVPPVLLHSAQTETAQQQDTLRASMAIDPTLNAYAHRFAPRRRLGFGAAATPTPTTLSFFGGTVPTASAEACGCGGANGGVDAAGSGGHGVNSSTSKELLDAFWREDAARQDEDLKRTRREMYEDDIRTALRFGFGVSDVTTDTDKKVTDETPRRQIFYSLLDQFFADGVPDVEPWDLWALAMPRYGAANLATTVLLDRVHHPVLQETHYSRQYLHRSEERPVVLKLTKTREELRAERRERLRKAKEERDRARRRALQEERREVARNRDTSMSLTGSSAGKDRLTNSNLRFNLFADSVLNPLGTENKIFSQYQERFLEHQRRNHDRHVAAIPFQIEKRKRDLRRHAEEYPVFCAYRIYPIYSPSHLGKLRNFANDGLLRGFFLWVRGCDALVVLTGGSVAIRHLDRWICEKMKWESPETTAVRLFTCPLQDAATFFFVSAKCRKRGQHLVDCEEEEEEVVEREGLNGNIGDKKKSKNKNRKDGGEHVYMNFVDSVKEGEEFMRSMPTEGPWKDLLHVWRAAFASGIQKMRK